MINDREKYQVQRAMITFGGSFAHALGKALVCADPENAQKIKETWADEWAQYLQMAQRADAIEAELLP